jgi:phospholipid/cholesterol/gamma-HCH transport system substrate-binding protein
MDSSNRYIKLGIFVILISVIFTFLIYKVSGGRGLINNSITIYAEFSNVEGLLVGNNVRYAGVKIGTVEDIKVMSDRVLMVEMSLDKTATDYMQNDAEADISTNGLVGNMIVNITPGKGSGEAIKDGDTIKNKISVELTEMLGTLSDTNDKIAQITDALLEITQKINSGTGSIAQLINDGSLATHLNTTIQNLSVTSRYLKVSTDSIYGMIADASEGRGNLGYLLRDTSLKYQIMHLSENLDSLVNERVEPIMGNLERSSLSLVNTTNELESIIRKIEKGEGLMGSVLKDTSITEDLKKTMENLNRGTQKFDESMEALQHHWLLRGFFKNKEKEAIKAGEKKKD